MTRLAETQINKELLKEIRKIKTNMEKIRANTNSILLEVKPKITNLEIREDKIIAQLSNGQKPEIPIDWFAKWGVKGVNSEKLKAFEIWKGRNIYFPKINEVLGIEKFIAGFDAPCE